ncbi:hypothetical protein Psta_0287 [Pirellula staleyi DSM 6068]|uniref:Uncharacterized protein n=1 Tax=Pirellula staleyi (strain ATCC 27377 / DSM 6068 / ICPB 4128) TaxID=530564 RepID=D2R1J5_PIRSD|nr:hypothetical protein [Pirellula staleyi]ADB14980.1 hypothetical protein Psta_0287 [Pirellula staleyi DSM 6068]
MPRLLQQKHRLHKILIECKLGDSVDLLVSSINSSVRAQLPNEDIPAKRLLGIIDFLCEYDLPKNSADPLVQFLQRVVHLLDQYPDQCEEVKVFLLSLSTRDTELNNTQHDSSTDNAPAGHHPAIGVLVIATTHVELDAMKSSLNVSDRLSIGTLEYWHGTVGGLEIAVTQSVPPEGIVILQETLQPSAVIYVCPVICLKKQPKDQAHTILASTLHENPKQASRTRSLRLCDAMTSYMARTLPSGRYANVVEILDIPQWEQLNPAALQHVKLSFVVASDNSILSLLKEIDSPVALLGSVVWRHEPRSEKIPTLQEILGSEAHHIASEASGSILHEILSTESCPYKNAERVLSVDSSHPGALDVWIRSPSDADDVKPFVNRAQFRTDLVRLLRPGNPRTMVVSGEEGSGKSFLFEFLMHLHITNVVRANIIPIQLPKESRPPEWTWRKLMQLLCEGLKIQRLAIDEFHDPSEFVSRYLVRTISPSSSKSFESMPARHQANIFVFDGFARQGFSPDIYDTLLALEDAIASCALPNFRCLVLGCNAHTLLRDSPSRIVRTYKVDDVPEAADIDGFIAHFSRQHNVAPSPEAIQTFRETISFNVAAVDERLGAAERHIRMLKVNSIFLRASQLLLAQSSTIGGV